MTVVNETTQLHAPPTGCTAEFATGWNACEADWMVLIREQRRQWHALVGQRGHKGGLLDALVSHWCLPGIAVASALLEYMEDEQSVNSTKAVIVRRIAECASPGDQARIAALITGALITGELTPADGKLALYGLQVMGSAQRQQTQLDELRKVTGTLARPGAGSLFELQSEYPPPPKKPNQGPGMVACYPPLPPPRSRRWRLAQWIFWTRWTGHNPGAPSVSGSGSRASCETPCSISPAPTAVSTRTGCKTARARTAPFAWPVAGTTGSVVVTPCPQPKPNARSRVPRKEHTKMSNDAVTRGGSHTSYNNLVFLCDGSELPTLRKMRCATCRMHVSHQMREVTVHHASLPLASCTWVCEICRRVTWSRL